MENNTKKVGGDSSNRGHNGIDLCPESIKLTKYFFDGLTKICDVVIIAGNHDYTRNSDNNICSLSFMHSINPCNKSYEIIPMNGNNIYHLIDSGYYKYGNINFIHNSFLQETILPPLDSTCVNVGLYHGYVSDVISSNYNNCTNYKKFAGYDYVLLGDTHRHHFIDVDKTIAYAGSLIQQNHKESLTMHGVLIWNIVDGKTVFDKIKNECGFCTISVTDGNITYMPDDIPKKIRLRAYIKNTSNVQWCKILDCLSQKYELMTITTHDISNEFTTDNEAICKPL